MRSLLAAAMLCACASAHAETGIASVYTDFEVACPGERYNARAFIAAHKTLPCGTIVKVTNRSNGRSVRVRIVDRGPFVRGRIIDLTPAGAKRLGFDGLAPVTVQ